MMPRQLPLRRRRLGSSPSALIEWTLRDRRPWMTFSKRMNELLRRHEKPLALDLVETPPL